MARGGGGGAAASGGKALRRLRRLLGAARGRAGRAQPAPRYALHIIRDVLLTRARGFVIPDEQPAIDVTHLSLIHI